MENRQIVIADTGFVVALLNRGDKHREAVAKIYARYPTILLPQTVLAEVAYMIGREAGTATVVTLLRSLPTSHFHLTALTDQDVKRVSDILEKYADSRIDFVDASVMAVAERYGSHTILTLDQRDFRLYRPVHGQSFEILP